MKKAGVIIYRKALVLSILALLVFPLAESQGHWIRNFPIQERVQPAARPARFWEGVFKREWQIYEEQHFLHRLANFRAFLIFSYNEAKHRLFPRRPNDHYIWTPELGYYPDDTIRRLNADVLHRDATEQHYLQAARRLRTLQERLKQRGVTLLIVPAPTKVRLYPEYVAPYLVAPAETIMKQAVSYGDVLEENGVNVLNVQRLLTEKKATSPWPFFTTTSFHWSYYTGCAVTDDILRKAETLSGRSYFAVDCSEVTYGKAQWSDTDIAVILNIFSKDAIIGKAPFPKITPRQNADAKGYKIAVIGDSFSDQIVYTLLQALPEESWTPDWLTVYATGVSRRMATKDRGLTPAEELSKGDLLREILKKELLILEVSDGMVYRDGNLDAMEYGVTKTLLEGLAPDAF